MRKRSLAARMIFKCKHVIEFFSDRFLYFCVSNSDSNWKDRVKSACLRLALRGRRLVAFFGECHMEVYAELLNWNPSFRKKYLPMGAAQIGVLVRKHGEIIYREDTWNKVDVLIYNSNVHVPKGRLELGQVLAWLPEDAERIEVTNAAFKGYMPQHTERVFPNKGYFNWGDKNLNALLNANHIDEAAVSALGEDGFYQADYVSSHFEKSLKQMRLSERECSVKIADYVEEHGRERVLYHSVTHPKPELMLELTARIACALGLDKTCLGKRAGTMAEYLDVGSHGELIYPSVWKALGIKEGNWETRFIQPGNYPVGYTFWQYVKEYLRMGWENMNMEEP